MDSQERERELIERARQGDSKAFEALAADHRAGLLSFIRTRLGKQLRARAEAEDILQETHLQAFDSIDRFEWRGERSFFKWTATIAEYVVRGLGRTNRENNAALDPDLADSGPSPSRVARREERFDRLETALESLHEDLLHRLIRVVDRPYPEALEAAEEIQRDGLERDLVMTRELLPDFVRDTSRRKQAWLPSRSWRGWRPSFWTIEKHTEAFLPIPRPSRELKL